MKVALVLSGDLRNFSECYPSLESNILRYNDCDVFLHMYESENNEKAIITFNPKKVIIDSKVDNLSDIVQSCFQNRPPETDPVAVFAMWKNIKKAFELVDESYDLILKTRFDIKYCSPLKLHEFDRDAVWIPEGGDWRGGLFDMMSFSSYENMRHYCSLHDRINEYSTNGVPCHSEIMLRYHMMKSNLSIQRFDFTVLLRRQFDKPWVEDRVFTLR